MMRSDAPTRIEPIELNKLSTENTSSSAYGLPDPLCNAQSLSKVLKCRGYFAGGQRWQLLDRSGNWRSVTV